MAPALVFINDLFMGGAAILENELVSEPLSVSVMVTVRS